MAAIHGGAVARQLALMFRLSAEAAGGTSIRQRPQRCVHRPLSAQPWFRQGRGGPQPHWPYHAAGCRNRPKIPSMRGAVSRKQSPRGLPRPVNGANRFFSTQKKTNERTTTFLRQGACSGAVGSLQAVWKDQRDTEPSVMLGRRGRPLLGHSGNWTCTPLTAAIFTEAARQKPFKHRPMRLRRWVGAAWSSSRAAAC